MYLARLEKGKNLQIYKMREDAFMAVPKEAGKPLKPKEIPSSLRAWKFKPMLGYENLTKEQIKKKKLWAGLCNSGYAAIGETRAIAVRQLNDLINFSNLSKQEIGNDY